MCWNFHQYRIHHDPTSECPLNNDLCVTSKQDFYISPQSYSSKEKDVGGEKGGKRERIIQNPTAWEFTICVNYNPNIKYYTCPELFFVLLVYYIIPSI